MFRVVTLDETIDSPLVDGLPEDAERERETGEPSAASAWSTNGGSDATLQEYKFLPSADSRTSLVYALHTSLSSSSSLRDEFHDCVHDTGDDANGRVGEGDNPLLDFYVAFDDDDDFTGDRRVQPEAFNFATTEPSASRMDVSEQASSAGDSSDSVLLPARATSVPVSWTALSIVSRGSTLVYSAAGLALRTAFLPVTLPLHITGSLFGRAVSGTAECQSVKDREGDEEDEVSSNGSSDSTTAKDQCTASSNDLSFEKINGIDESDVRGWTAPLDAAMKVALFPVTGPMYLASAAGSVAVNGCSAALSVTASLLEQALGVGSDSSTPRDTITSDSSCSDEARTVICENDVGLDVTSTTPCGKVIAAQTAPSSTEGLNGLTGLTETMKDVTFKVLSDLSFLMDSVSPSLRDTLIDPRQEDRMLDRLRLDYHLENARVLDNVTDPVLPVTPASSFYSAASSITVASDLVGLQSSRLVATPYHYAAGLPASIQPCPRFVSPVSSDALLRVDDLGMYRTNPDREAMVMSRLYYLDLNADLITELGDEAMSRLVGRGLGLVSNLKEARLHSTLHHHGAPKSIVDWKPERGSSDLMQRLSKLSRAERVVQLQSNTIVWSGQFRHPDGQGNKPFPLFASRGIIPWKPLDFVSLMWDDSRVQVYNKLCTGRSTVRVFRDEIDAGGSRGTKLVHFTTRVPLTNFTVTMTSLLHIAPIQTMNEEDAFIIISRSICSGRSGSHFESHDHVEPGSKSEIIWGVNIVRPVPNRSHLTDLTSVSQVGTTMVPNILARKIGLWGVEDFYKNVRNRGE